MKTPYITSSILVIFCTLMSLLMSNSSAMAGECTKFEDIKLIEKGFTKQQIEQIWLLYHFARQARSFIVQKNVKVNSK